MYKGYFLFLDIVPAHAAVSSGSSLPGPPNTDPNLKAETADPAANIPGWPAPTDFVRSTFRGGNAYSTPPNQDPLRQWYINPSLFTKAATIAH